MVCKFKTLLLLLCIVYLLPVIGCGEGISPDPTPIKGMSPGEYRDSFDAKPTKGKTTKPARSSR